MRSTHNDSDVTRLQSMPGTLKSDWDLNSTDAKTPKIELELFMSDVETVETRTGTFQLSTNL